MQNGNRRYFPETGHNVENEFLDFYQRAPNPELVYGYPITEAFIGGDGLIIQYFQRARFELHPEAPEPLRVQLTPLGNLLYEPAEPYPLNTNPSVCRAFPETGYQVCYSFLQFFDEHGGITQFGYPISLVEFRDNRFVQYFQRARFEWHPESAGLGQEVQLTQLGRLYFGLAGEDPLLLRPAATIGVPEILALRVHAFPVKTVVSRGESQSLFVIVQDQNFNPVSNVQITLTIILPSGKRDSFSLGQTNEFGFTNGLIEFESGEEDIGIVEIEVIATNPSFRERTITSFRIAP